MLGVRNQIDVSVGKWAAWAPGVETPADWEQWARGERTIGPLDAKPAVSFVKPLVRRRLSRLSKMSLEVAEACSLDAAAPFYVFCSRFGEYTRTVEALSGLVRGEPISPAMFSQSVHNTSAGHYTINHSDQTPTTTVAAAEATLEAGFLEAWTALDSGKASRALVVYHDEPLPDPFENPYPVLDIPIAAAFVVGLPDHGGRLSLSWSAGSSARTGELAGEEHPVLQVLRLVMGGPERVLVPTRRLSWEWQRHVQ